MEIGKKQALTGLAWKVVMKLATKYVNVFVYEEGDSMRILKEIEENGSSPTVRPLPRPGNPRFFAVNE